MEHFEALIDPRMERRKLHKLHDIIFIPIAAVLCGCDEWNDIEEFGQIRYDWLKTILELPNGIPSDDTFRYSRCLILSNYSNALAVGYRR